MLWAEDINGDSPCEAKTLRMSCKTWTLPLFSGRNFRILHLSSFLETWCSNVRNPTDMEPLPPSFQLSLESLGHEAWHGYQYPNAAATCVDYQAVTRRYWDTFKGRRGSTKLLNDEHPSKRRNKNSKNNPPHEQSSRFVGSLGPYIRSLYIS